MQPDNVTRFMRLAGWRRAAAAALCGICAAAALPPLHLLPLVLPAFSGLLLLLEGAARPRRAFWDGWWFGAGFFVGGIYWICISLLTDPERFAWLIPFALFGLPGVLAVYCGLAGWLTWRVKWRGTGKAIAFAAIWTAMEWVRGHAFTGFPWNLAGYVWTVADAPMQIVSVTGIYGLSFLTVVFAAMPAVAEKRSLWIALAAALCIIGWGQWRIAATPSPMEPGVTLRLVQGNIPQKLKWEDGQQYDNLRHYERLTTGEGYGAVTHVIWPEASVPFALQPGSDLAREMGTLAPPGGALITGAVRVDERGRIYNGIQAIAPGGRALAQYDKHRLVPFGEFVPLRLFLPIEKVTHGSQDFSRGDGPRTLTVEGLPPFSPLVCYEAAFPELAINRGDSPRPRWLLNLTNDAWFGNSSGPYQHFQAARTRAVEQGLPMVRLAGGGISAVIDPLGRVLAKRGLNETAALDSGLPRALPEKTLFAEYQDIPLYVLVIFFLLLGRLSQKKQKI